MEQRMLGGLRCSAIGLGCMGMSHAYGEPADHKEMGDLLARAVDMGYTMFDTAEAYGTKDNPHDNEELLGKVLKPYRDKVVIATKFGLGFGEACLGSIRALVPDSRPESIRTAVEGSLRRLRTERIDLYYQHRMDPSVEPEEVAEVMNGLIREGKILHWGLSEPTEEYLRRAHKVCPVSAVQSRFSMMARWNERLFPALEELGIGFVAFSPLANGLLSRQYTATSQFDTQTDYRASMPQFRKESFERNTELFCMLDTFAENYRATPSQVALAWMLCRKPWIVPIPGTRRIDRLEENAGAASLSLSPDEIGHIDTLLENMEMSEVFGGSRIERRRP